MRPLVTREKCIYPRPQNAEFQCFQIPQVPPGPKLLNFNLFKFPRFLHIFGLMLPTCGFQVYHLFKIVKHGMEDALNFDEVLIMKKSFIEMR